MKFSFENLHRNHKLAYLDGLLCGIGFTLIGVMLYKDWKEEREFMAQVKKNKEAAQLMEETSVTE